MSAQKVLYKTIKSIWNLRAYGEFQFYYTWIEVPSFFSISVEYSNDAFLWISRHFFLTSQDEYIFVFPNVVGQMIYSIINC